MSRIELYLCSVRMHSVAGKRTTINEVAGSSLANLVAVSPDGSRNSSYSDMCEFQCLYLLSQRRKDLASFSRHELYCDVPINGKKFLNARRTIPRAFNSFPPHSLALTPPIRRGPYRPTKTNCMQSTNAEGEQSDSHSKMVLSFILIQNRQYV